PCEKVYDRWILLKSYLALSAQDTIRVPEMVEPLIERVYGREPLAGPDSPTWQQALADAEKKLTRKRKEHEQAARTFLIGRPDSSDEIMADFNQQLEEDDPELPKTHQAFTRLA